MRTCMLVAVGDVRIEMPRYHALAVSVLACMSASASDIAALNCPLSDEVAGYYSLLLPVVFLTCLDLAHLYVLASLFLAFGSAVRHHDASKYAGSLDEYYTTTECCKLRFPETVENAHHLKAEMDKLESEIAAENANDLENLE